MTTVYVFYFLVITPSTITHVGPFAGEATCDYIRAEVEKSRNNVTACWNAPLAVAAK